MIVESVVGRVNIVSTSRDTEANLVLEADAEVTLRSVLDLLELVGGAENEDTLFDAEAIEKTTRFGKAVYRTELTRTQVSRYLDAEIHNYLDYTSLGQMRKQKK